MIHPLAKEFDRFLASNLRSTWLEVRSVHAYVRKSQRFIDGRLRNFIDIANVRVAKAKRGKGVFKGLVQLAMQVDSYEGVYVECVMNEQLAAHLNRNNWTMIDRSPPDFYKRKDTI